MEWLPISEREITDIIKAAIVNMDNTEKRLWDFVSTFPEIWKQQPCGSEGKGFWAVGLIGQRVVWYNDIEDGFNISKYLVHGEIGEYWCNQDCLLFALKKLYRMIFGKEAE